MSEMIFWIESKDRNVEIRGVVIEEHEKKKNHHKTGHYSHLALQ